MARIQLGHDFSRSNRLAPLGLPSGQSLHQALAAATLFGRPAGGLRLPQSQAPEYQAVAADIDKDGDEDKTAVRNMPLTAVAGLAIAAGAIALIEFEPLRWVKILNFIVEPELAKACVLTDFTIGQDPQFPSKGAIPLTAFAADATDKTVDVPWCGPGVPLSLSVKNISADPVVFYGAARVVAIIG